MNFLKSTLLRKAELVQISHKTIVNVTKSFFCMALLSASSSCALHTLPNSARVVETYAKLPLLDQPRFEELFSFMLKEWEGIAAIYATLSSDQCTKSNASVCEELDAKLQNSIDRFIQNYRAASGENSSGVHTETSSEEQQKDFRITALRVLLKKHHIVLRSAPDLKGSYTFILPTLFPVVFQAKATLTDDKVKIVMIQDPVSSTCDHFRDKFNPRLVEDNFEEFAQFSGGLPNFTETSAELDFVSTSKECGYKEIFPKQSEGGYTVGRNIVSIIGGVNEDAIRQHLSLEDIVSHELVHVYFNYWYSFKNKSQTAKLSLHTGGYSREVTYVELEEAYANLQSSFFEVKKLSDESGRSFLQRMKNVQLNQVAYYGLVAEAHSKVLERYNKQSYTLQSDGKTEIKVDTEHKNLMLRSILGEAYMLKNYLMGRKDAPSIPPTY